MHLLSVSILAVVMYLETNLLLIFLNMFSSFSYCPDGTNYSKNSEELIK